jgi:general secretion pathway protein F
MSSTPSQPAAISLDELIALNDEIAALVRAGVPLDRGLAALGSDMPGRLGRFAAVLGERTARGESLQAALAEPAAKLPPAYRAVVVAGVRAGRLPAALESLAGSIRRLAETRRSVAAGSLYSLFVLVLVWVFFAFFTVKLAPKLLYTFQALGIRASAAFAPLAWCGRWADVWGPLGPAVLVLAGGLWWYCSTRASVAGRGWANRLLGLFPWLGSTLRLSRIATFVEILTLLVENDVPLADAVLLAGEASGDARLLPAAKKMAAALRSGAALRSADIPPHTLPPLLVWLMAGTHSRPVLLSALRRTADAYHRRAQHQADLARVFLPVVFTVGIGGTATLLYALALFVPYTTMLKELAGG